jgi:hypothetical protein
MSTPTPEDDQNNTEILLNLKFLGKIKPSVKIYLDPNQRLLSDSLTNSIIRSLFYSDSRDTTLSFVTNTIKKSLVILGNIYNSPKQSNISKVKSIKADLNLAKIGLENLVETYKDDVKFQCSLDLINELIDGTILDLELPLPVKLNSVYDEDSDSEYSDFEEQIIPVGNVPKKTFAEIAKSTVKKPEVKPIEVKPEVKSVVKPEVKPVVKKVEVKPVEVKKEVKPVVKPVVKPAVKKSLPVKIPVKKTKL